MPQIFWDPSYTETAWPAATKFGTVTWWSSIFFGVSHTALGTYYTALMCHRSFGWKLTNRRHVQIMQSVEHFDVEMSFQCRLDTVHWTQIFSSMMWKCVSYWQCSISVGWLGNCSPVLAPGCKNWPAPFPGRMSYKATKPGLALSVVYLSLFYCIVVY